MASFTLERTINLPVEKVWDILGNFTVSPGPEIKVEVEKQGDQANNGVGTIRKLTIGNVCVKEILESANPPNSFTYRVLSGALTKEYKGKVNFKKNGEETIIHLKADIKPIIPFTSPIIIKVAKGAINSILDSLEKNHT